MEEKSYYNMDVKCWYETLGQEAREEFIKWLRNSKEFSPRRSDCINYNYGTSYCNDLYRAGRSMVYLYTDKNGVPFYVGKGDEHRAISIYSRSDAFKERLGETDTCRIFGIVFDIMESDALEVETLCINELLNRGWRLTNRSKVCISQEELIKLRSTYPNVIDTLNSISSAALNYLLGDDPFNGVGEVIVDNKSNVKKKKHAC